MSGRNFKVKAKSWASFQLDHLEIPAGAVTAEILVRSVTAVAADGIKFEDKPLWELEGGLEWPEKPATK